MEFLDTNVLVYAASDKTADQQKAGVARDLLRRGPSEFAITQDGCRPWLDYFFP